MFVCRIPVPILDMASLFLMLLLFGCQTRCLEINAIPALFGADRLAPNMLIEILRTAERRSLKGTRLERIPIDNSMNTVDVLLIGDSDVDLRTCVEAKPLARFHVTRRPTLASGLDALQASCFKLVILSLSLPDSSSAKSVAETVRMAPDSPVIVLGNQGDITKVEEAIALGAKDYVLRGCHADCLTRTMRFALERKQLVGKAEADLQQMTDDRAELVAHLSHEVRNALACIHQFGNIMIDGLAGSLSGEQNEYLGIMLENATRIRVVLDGLLEPTMGATGEDTSSTKSTSNTAN
jgi:DNA-binding response OmpR family regulator